MNKLPPAHDAGADAGFELDATLDADRGPYPTDAADASDDATDAQVPEVVRGDDFIAFPSLQPKADGELRVRFVVPRGARSFVLTVNPHSPRRVLLVELIDPGGAHLFDALAAAPLGLPLERAVTYNLEPELPLSVLYPNAPEADFEPGTYEARLFLDDVRDRAASTASVDVVFGRPVDEQVQRRLGMQLWIAAGAALDEQSLFDDEGWLSALDQVRAIFGDAGIRVGDIGLGTLGAHADDITVIDGPASLARVTELLADYPGRGVHVVLVDRIEAGLGKTVLGKTTGMPVPPPHDALRRRGAVILALESLPASARRIAELFAHEIGHALGLRHTSEADGLRHDPLLDTPECPADRATFESSSGALLLTAEDCAEFDGGNLLFYAPVRTSRDQRELSADQTWVLGRNPAVL